MSTYLDSSVLVALYVPDEKTSEAISLVKECTPPLPLNALQELEVHNAIHLKVAAKAITAEEASAALAAFESDIAARRFIRVHPNWNAIFAEAQSISDTFVSGHPCRVLEILHLAASHFTQVDEFVSLYSWQIGMGAKINEHKELIQDTLTGGG